MTMETNETKPKRRKATKKAEEPSREPKLVKRVLPVKLTESERLEKGDELAATFEEIAKLEGEKKASADSFKATIELVEQRAKGLAATIRSGEEKREVSCVEKHIFATNCCEVFREDTGALVERRALTLSERQPSLLPDDPDAIDQPQEVLDGFDHAEKELGSETDLGAEED